MGGQGEKAGSIAYSEETSPTLRASESGTNRAPDVVYAMEGNTVDRASNKNGKGWCEGVSPTLNTQDRHAVAIDCRNIRESVELSGTIQAKNNGGYSLNYQNPVVYDKQRLGVYGENGVSSTLEARDYKDAADLVVECGDQRKYIVRRLTPLECCRLQGFPDWWGGRRGRQRQRQIQNVGQWYRTSMCRGCIMEDRTCLNIRIMSSDPWNA